MEQGWGSRAGQGTPAVGNGRLWGAGDAGGGSPGAGDTEEGAVHGGSSGGWGSPGSRGCSVKCWSGSRPSA